MVLPILCLKQVYLAGGCFWGVQEVFRGGKGILRTVVGYANSNVEKPTYQEVRTGTTGAVETVLVEYDETLTSVHDILRLFFQIIDPLTPTGEGPDIGNNYRPGVYYTDENEREDIQSVFEEEQALYDEPIEVELASLTNFFEAEEYHENYLHNNPNGYCHIDLGEHKMK